MTCIFCGNPADSFTREHMIPESLGGDDYWALLPDGLVCSGCNQYFGSKVEPLALRSWPFVHIRVFAGIPTKKRRPAVTGSSLGPMFGDPRPGKVGVGLARSLSGPTRLSFEYSPTEPVAVCRLLLKMGIEGLAKHSPEKARSAAYGAARQFARAPATGSEWSFGVIDDLDRMEELLTKGITFEEWCRDVKLLHTVWHGVEIVVFRLIHMDIFAPLTPVKVEFTGELTEPKYRAFRVRV